MRMERRIQLEAASDGCDEAAICTEHLSDAPEHAALASRHRVAFGRNLRQARIEAALTLDDVAAMSGLPRICLNAIEAGRCDPRLRTMTAIADAVGCELWTLVQ